MSESIVRKVQPFTIGTKLSVPAVPKCQDFTPSYLQDPSLDNLSLQHNLNSLYLSQSQVCAHDSCQAPPVVQQVAPVKEHQEHMATEDQLNQNVSCSSSVSRSIKKITISGKEKSEDKPAVGAAAELWTPETTESASENNNNNNNNISSTTVDPPLPRIVGVSCENKPNSQFKVLLKKDTSDLCQSPHGKTRVKINGEKSVHQISAAESQKQEPQWKQSHPQTQKEALAAVASQSDCFTQRNSLFNKEVLQAEAWIKGKLQDLKDGCNVQRCPLQDWEEASQTLQRDLKDFENTLIQLNQMGEQLICKLNPTSDLVKKQLSQLRDQWQTLKQTAANQMKALGGAKNLQEFNKKVDKLEAWIKEKEEEQSLLNVLGDNVDKLQLTRRLLDLKQDEQLYRNLHEEINSLALKLEKQGKTDGKNISTRRKHINKMWLKVQSHLKNYHENLQLALEVSSFYQQADNILFSINNMRKNISASGEWESLGDREIRDIASQIMMLDVNVSQLSNLHPALAAGVTQKQSEVKDCWALLHKVFRSDRTAMPPTGSAFSREDVDPLTLLREPQSCVGTETQRLMGKEVKEEQNRLKGCVSAAECESGRRTQSSQSQEQQSVNHTSLPEGHSANEVIIRRQSKAESTKPRTEPKAATGPHGHPQLHIQLQKFTASADKTLSWLKDNVSMATQVCSIASFEGLEAARRCQHTLERDILTNRARIEVVKKEGRGLVRAQHPGSARIEEFLSQLEVLWEELRRRHQRNALFLQTSEQLGFRVVKVLQGLGSLEAWLESVELSMKESVLASDPETMSVAQRGNCMLEEEVAERSLELSALREEVDQLHVHSHPHTQWLLARMEEVEKKYHSVKSAMTQPSSKLQDARMLTEFLERVELEESHGVSQFNLGQPLHSEVSSALSMKERQSSSVVVGEALIHSIGDTVEECKEILNDRVGERGRSPSHDQGIQELLRKHASLAVRVEECLCYSKDLGLDILEKETDLAIQCEPERCGLEALQEKQDHLEIDYEVIREEVKEMKNLASRLEELCPERTHTLRAKIQATLLAWTQLGKSVTENNSRLQEFMELQDFFRSYLAMISWTEDTRSCIFSNNTLNPRKDGKRPLAAELDIQIEQRFKEFDKLAATGRSILDEEHHLTQMVKERLEELRSMLGWILVHWRAQKQQWLHKKSKIEPSQDGIYTEATLSPTVTENSAPALVAHRSLQSQLVPSVDDRLRSSGDNQPPSVLPRQTELQEKQIEDGYEVMKNGYEVMNSFSPRAGETSLSESPKPSITVLKDPGGPALGSTVNLILSFGNTAESQVQVLDLPAKTDEVMEDTAEPVHRVSTYLHVKDNNLAAGPVYESISLPRHNGRSTASASPTLYSSSSSSCSSASGPQSSNVTFHPLTGSGSSSIFSSLKRMGKRRKRKGDARRHTIQKIMGVEAQTEEEPQYACEGIIYDTHTWPLKEGRRKKSSPKGPVSADEVESLAYVKNPLAKDIETECSGEYSITPYAVSEGPTTLSSTNQVKSHCRFMSLGSVLSFELPKDMSLIPSIQDIITIAPPESKKAAGTDPDPHSQRHLALSSFKQTRPNPVITQGSSEPSTPEIHTSSAAVKAVSDMNHRSKQAPSLTQDQSIPNHSSKTDVSVCEAADPFKRNTPDRNRTTWPSELPIYVNQAQCTVLHKHQCPSVHTRIRDLNGHIYHRGSRPHSMHEHSSGPQYQNQASHVRVNLKSTMSLSVRQDSVDSGISTSSCIKVSTNTLCPDAPPKGVVGRIMSFQVEATDCTKPKEDITTSSTPSPQSSESQTEPVHLDHKQFQEEEEELEDIWNQTNCRQSISSDIIYQSNQEDPAPSLQSTETHAESPSPETPNVLYRNLVTASAPNLLVAEFKLPSHIQSLLGYNKEQNANRVHLPPLAKGDRRSWAAFPHRESNSRTAVFVNETASDPVKLPDVCDNQRYIYQYKEDEEEGGDMVKAKVMEEVDDHTGCLKDQSMSLLSVHMDLGAACQQKQSSQSPEHVERQGDVMATGGRRFTLSGKSDLQSMEGTLERKHKLQLGGKKAASRGWNSYHAVLFRNTLCFYQDRKETLKSSACGLPLNLMGAECSPAPDYTKKSNCFRLQLRDGSEYLFNAPSRFMMRKWVIKIQANTGQSVSMSSVSIDPDDPVLPSSLNPSSCPSCRGLAKCHCSSRHDVTSMFPRHKAAGAAQTKEIVVLTREFSQMPQSHLRSLDEQSVNTSTREGCCGDDEVSTKLTVNHRLSAASTDSTSSSSMSSPPHPPSSIGQDWLSNKRRSHSFTSATYQKIKPIPQPPGGLDRGSNYCVTLVVGDKLSDGSSTSRTSEPPLVAVAGWQQEAHQDSAQRSYTSLPRPRNKSVFKKFFGKKDL